jgi:cytidyltransferase-like protein
MNQKTVVIFGVFDGIHEGHRAFIKGAREHGDRLVGIVARDSVVEKLKGKIPDNREADRIKMLLEVPEIDIVYLGDIEEGTYKMLREVHPSVVYLGYDQVELFEDLKHSIESGTLPDMELLVGEAHRPDEFHNSIIKNKDSSNSTII